VARYDYNLIVIGGGSAGLIAALIAATVGARVALVERDRMGGDCLNTGCVPSKTLIRSAKAAQTLRSADRYGLAATTPQVDFARVMQRVQRAIATIEPKDSMARYESLGVNCFAGTAELIDDHHVRVGDRMLSTRKIVLATGAEPFVPPIPGLREAEPLTSDNLWSLTEQPDRLLVMGGGPIGCELAQAFARLGSRVTLIDMAPRLLPREDEETSTFIAERFAAEGIDVRLGHRAVRVEDGALLAEAGDETVRLPFDRVLVAVGRRARADTPGLEGLGLALNPDGTLAVDEYLRTSRPGIFACGDAVGPYQFTHMASHQAWYAAVNALFGRLKKFRVNYDVVPWTTYTDPEVAHVGLTMAEARETGTPVEITRWGFDDSDRGIADGTTEGWIKVLTPPGKDRILGVTIVGPAAGELLAEFVLAMTHGLGLKKIMSTIHVYPTLAEGNKAVASAWRKAHAPQGLLKLVGRLFALLR